MSQIPEITNIAHTIQLAVAPVFLLAGSAGFLNVCAARLARIIDRVRTLEPLLLTSRGGEHDRHAAELRVLDKRISVVNTCISLAVLSACLTCLVVVLLFTSQLLNAPLDTLIALLFIALMTATGAAFALFLVETRMGSRVIHVRNEVLEHRAKD